MTEFSVSPVEPAGASEPPSEELRRERDEARAEITRLKGERA